MGDFLMGKEVSGTPVETRGGVRAFSNFLQQLMQPGGGGMGQLTTDALMSIMANPEIAASLINPADQTRGLFASMMPFEDRQVRENVAGVRSIFGTAGGRFGRNVATAEAETRGELANQFARARQEALLTAEGQRKNFLASLLQGATQTAGTGLGAMAQFFQPGPAQFQQGALPGLISAGTSLLAAKMLGPAGSAISQPLVNSIFSRGADAGRATSSRTGWLYNPMLSGGGYGQ